MINFLGRTIAFFRPDSEITKGKPVIRKIRNSKNGSFTIALPPILVNEILKQYNTEFVEIDYDVTKTGEIKELVIRPSLKIAT